MTENKDIKDDPKQPNSSSQDRHEEPKADSKIILKVIEDEMKKSYIDYSMSVIVGRALPDVRDGLKPVHRRILYAMYDMGLAHNKPFKKCARIVGETLGKYHPHGDTAVYETLVRMAQNFSLRYTLVDGQGNFGSVDGDNPAAMRYTEARLTKFAEELLEDLDKETVDFQPNFDASLKEPIVLPSKFPNLLVNGSSGIAVGMATNIPPHNMGEIIDGTISLIDDPEISVEELMHHIRGPDFPTGAAISGMNGIKSAYLTGRGKITVKAKAEIIPHKDRERIIVTEIPYQVNKAMLLEQIAELIKIKKIIGISDIRDESSERGGMRVVVDLKKDANSQVVLNQLFTFTNMTVTFGANMLALVNNEPKTLNLKQLIENFVLHRRDVVRRRTQFELRKAEERCHVIEGLIIALNNIDIVIQKIKKSKTVEDAKKMLMLDYKLTDIQAHSILEMKLQKLSSLEQEKIRQEHTELKKLIEELKAILASEEKILDIIKKELAELKQKYADERKTRIEFIEEEDLIVEDLIKEEDMVVTISHNGYIKRLPVATYKQQGRGGIGVKAAGTGEEDFIEHLFVSSTHNYLLFFSNKGKVYWQKVYQIPEASRQAKGRAIVNLIPLEKDEKINAFIPVKEFDESHNLILCTKKGIVKKTQLSEYSRPRQGGIIAITLDDGDSLVNAVLTDGNKEIIIATKEGIAARFHERDARPIGRTARGVRGINLEDTDTIKDEVVGMIIADKDHSILSVTENGYGKRTPVEDYRLINRGGKGVINIQCSERNGHVVSVNAVTDEDEVMLISRNGVIIRTSASGISCIGRNTQGVRLMKLRESDNVVAATKIAKEEPNGVR